MTIPSKLVRNVFALAGLFLLGTSLHGASLANISTRGRVQNGDNVLIGGFIIDGDSPKSVLVRAMGPSLEVGGVPVKGVLENPTLELHNSSRALIATNDDHPESFP